MTPTAGETHRQANTNTGKATGEILEKFGNILDMFVRCRRTHIFHLPLGKAKGKRWRQQH